MTFTPAGNLAATDVQAALEELDSEKAAASHTQAASTITDFTEASQDVIGAMITAAGGSYNDGAGTITLPSGGSADDWDIVSSTTQSSPYAPSGLTGNTVIKITAQAGNLTLNVPTGTFGSSKRFYVQYIITASGGARTITLGTGMSLGLGVAANLVIASGATLILTFYTDDNGTSFAYDGDLDASKLASATPAASDLLIFADNSNSNALSQATLLASESNAGSSCATGITCRWRPTGGSSSAAWPPRCWK